MTTSATSASALSNQYMTLLVTQLQHQDPLEPMNNSEMTAQLTSMSQLEKLESLDNSFSKVLAAQQQLQATDLIGKNVTFIVDEQGNLGSGTVESIDFSSDTVRLKIGESLVNMSQVSTISQ